MTKLESQIEQFEKSVKRLEEVLKQEKNDFMRDSSIQRFEIAMDLAWKVLKSILEEKDNVVVHSPTSAFREAYKQGYLDNDGDWITFMKMRNETAHIYKEEMADEVYTKLPVVLGKLRNLLQNLKLR